MFIKNLFKIGLVAVFAASVVTLEAKPRKGKEKPDKPRPEKKIDREKMKNVSRRLTTREKSVEMKRRRNLAAKIYRAPN